MGRLFMQFSFPGGVPSHVAPETPGLRRRARIHAYGAVLDKPDLIVACVVGDGEAETGPLATSWHANKFLNPKTDGCVLPILHLNGFKIANPTILDRIPDAELLSLFVGYRYEPILVEGNDPANVHPAMARALDECADKIRAIQEEARSTDEDVERPSWPMIILRTPTGWTGPHSVDEIQIEGSYLSHQVPISNECTSQEPRASIRLGRLAPVSLQFNSCRTSRKTHSNLISWLCAGAINQRSCLMRMVRSSRS